MAWEALVLLFLVPLLFLALAGWILYLDPNNSLHRSFGLFLFLRAFAGGIGLLAIVDPSRADLWGNYRGYYLLALPFVIVDFFLLYNWREPTHPRRIARVALIAGAVSAEVAYLNDHSVLLSPTGEAPLAFLNRATFFLAALLGLWFAVAARRAHTGVQARFNRLLAVSWASLALVEGSLYWSAWPTSGLDQILGPSSNPLYNVASLLSVLQLPLGLATGAILVLDPKVRGPGRSWIISLLGASAVFAFAAGLVLDDVGGVITAADTVFLLLLGVARLIAPAVLAYAIARQSSQSDVVFDLDYRVRVAFRRSSMGGILLAGYFVVSQLAGDIFQNVSAFQSLGPVWSQVFGMGSAALLLLVLHPLGRVADRMAQSALPRSEPIRRMSKNERLHVYEEQVEIAWADGSLSRKERLLLDRLRDRLHVPLPEAAAIERRVLKVAT